MAETILRVAGRTLPLALLLAACGAPDPRPAATRAMAERLEALAHAQETAASPFLPEALVRRYAAIPAPPDLRSRVLLQVRLAQALLAAGDTGAAIAELDAARETVDASALTMPAGFDDELDSLRAIANLRLAEQLNCIGNHSAQACILPLEGAALHRWTEGAERALALYGELLARRPDDLGARWLMNLSAMALGRHPEAVPEPWRIAPERFEAGAAFPAFRDVAMERGIGIDAASGGVVMEDFDRDGRLDLLVSSWGLRDPLRSFRGSGEGRFIERSHEDGLAGLTGGLNLLSADVDNDGWIDALVLRGAWLGAAGAQPNSLLRNRAGRGFEDVTLAAGLEGEFPTQAGAFGDFDADGWIDLFVGNEGTFARDTASRLYRNLGDGRFEEVSAAAGVEIRGFVKAALWVDLTEDGLPELVVSRLDGPNHVFLNRGPGAAPRFVDVAGAWGLQRPLGGFSLCAFDYDNDGRQDLFAFSSPADFAGARGEDYVADYLGLPARGEPGRVYRNRGEGRFDEVSAALGLDQALLVMGLTAADLDADGYLDLYLGTGAPDFRALVPNRLLRNRDGERFEDATAAARLGHLQKGHGIAAGDLDQDGDLDLYAVLGGAYPGDTYPNALFEHPGPAGAWVGLELEGSPANRAAIGARIALHLATPRGPRTLHRSVGATCSFGTSPLRLHIGLGDAHAIEAVEVQWPGSTRRERLPGPAPGRHWRLRQGEAGFRPAP